ncbi:MAG: rod shape-determining protein MreD [Clostridia bacterium]|nr:rod shape-determining protein MreD [Clostridia bacterium]
MAERINLYTASRNPRRKGLSDAKKRLYRTRAFYVILILVSVVLQNTPHLFPTILGAHAWLLLPLSVCISMFERNLSAGVFAILAGAFWDVATAKGDGFYAIFFLVTSTVVCVLMTYLFRNNLVTALLLSAAVILLFCVVHWLLFVLVRGNGTSLFLTFYLPSALYTFLFTPVYYVIIRKRLRALRDRYPKREFDYENA